MGLDEQLLDDLARVFAEAALRQLLDEAAERDEAKSSPQEAAPAS
jgi:hypothetical protein